MSFLLCFVVYFKVEDNNFNVFLCLIIVVFLGFLFFVLKIILILFFLFCKVFFYVESDLIDWIVFFVCKLRRWESWMVIVMFLFFFLINESIELRCLLVMVIFVLLWFVLEMFNVLLFSFLWDGLVINVFFVICNKEWMVDILFCRVCFDMFFVRWLWIYNLICFVLIFLMFLIWILRFCNWVVNLLVIFIWLVIVLKFLFVCLVSVFKFLFNLVIIVFFYKKVIEFFCLSEWKSFVIGCIEVIDDGILFWWYGYGCVFCDLVDICVLGWWNVELL